MSKIPKQEREKEFTTKLKLLIQEWNRSVSDYDIKNPDTEEQRLARLTNGLSIFHTSEKYGLSLVLFVTLDRVTYSAFIGRGTVDIETVSGEEILDYGDDVRSTSTISFKLMRTSVNENVRSLVVKGISEKESEIRLI